MTDTKNQDLENKCNELKIYYENIKEQYSYLFEIHTSGINDVTNENYADEDNCKIYYYYYLFDRYICKIAEEFDEYREYDDIVDIDKLKEKLKELKKLLKIITTY